MDAACLAYVQSEGKVYTTPRGLRALRTGCNVVDTLFSSACYWKRLEKYASRGFAIAVPGFMPDRVNKEVLKNTYLHLTKYDLLVKAGEEDTDREKIKIKYQEDPFLPKTGAVEIAARAIQPCTVVSGMLRAIIIDKGLAKLVGQSWVRDKKDAPIPVGCVPIRTGCGKYTLLWGVQEPLPLAVDRDDDDSDVGYEVSPMAAIHKLFERVHQQDALKEASDDGYWRGGAMQRIACHMANSSIRAARSVALDAFAARSSTGSHLHFVWDLVTTDCDFTKLKYVHDAGHSPLDPTADFERVYGITRHLQFDRRKKREAVETNLWEEVY